MNGLSVSFISRLRHKMCHIRLSCDIKKGSRDKYVRTAYRDKDNYCYEQKIAGIRQLIRSGITSF